MITKSYLVLHALMIIEAEKYLTKSKIFLTYVLKFYDYDSV